MSELKKGMELKARTARSIADEEEMLELGADCPIEPTQVYIKSEADKVIAELEEKHFNDLQSAEDSFKSILELNRKELLHHKYKRCLAMAQVLDHVCPITNRKSTWRDKWHKRWLELAEKFKETK